MSKSKDKNKDFIKKVNLWKKSEFISLIFAQLNFF